MLLLLITLLAQTPHHRLVLQPNLPRGAAGAGPLFQFAPPSGQGMGAVCACTTPSGSKGEALTFTRASSGTCLKGGTTTGIANGDMVTCTTDQPRVMPGGDGTGSLGLLVEETRTNSTLRSQEITNAAWGTQAAGGAALPTLTADSVVAPDGTTTADRVQVPATSVTQVSNVYQTGGCPSGAATFSLFVKGHGSTSGTLDFTFLGSATPTSACSYNGTTWTRCVLAKSSADTIPTFGSNKLYGGSSAGAAADVDVWGAQCEAGAFATSYIATTSAGVARAGELADVALTFGASTTGFSMSGTAVLEGLPTNPVILGCIGDRAPGVGTGSASYACPDSLSTVYRADTSASSTAIYSTGLTVTTASRRFAEFFTAAGVHNGCVDGVCGAGDTGKTWTPPTWLRWRLGNYAIATNASYGVVKELCLDGESSRCR